jgi:hypothetical protein
MRLGNLKVSEMSIRVPAPTIALLLMLTSCTERSAPKAHAFEVRQQDGVEVAWNNGVPEHSGALFRLEWLLDLIQDPERPESLLGGPSDFIRGPDGNYYVTDTRNRRIAVFGPDGQYLRSFGGPGGGPGMFSNRFGLQSLDGEVLTYFDPQLLRATRFRLSGELVEVLSLRKAGRIQSLRRIDAERLVSTTRPLVTVGDVVYSTVNAIISDAATGDTLATIVNESVPYWLVRFDETGARTGYANLLHGGNPFMIIDTQQGVYYSDGSRPVLDVYGFHGNLIRQIVFDWETTQITGKWKARYFAVGDSVAASRSEVVQDQWENTKKQIVFAETLGFWNRNFSFVDDAGYLWLSDSRHGLMDGDRGTSLYHVVAPDGEYLGSVNTPFIIDWVAGGHVTTSVMDDETGEWTQSVFRLIPTTSFAYP